MGGGDAGAAAGGGAGAATGLLFAGVSGAGVPGAEAPAGAGDTHDSLLRGSKASLHIRQGAEQGYKPVLYIEPNGTPDDAWRGALTAAINKLAVQWPGLAVKDLGGRFELVIPAEFKTGHEAHFGQVTELFLGYLQGKPVPVWEVPNTLAKYRTLMDAWRLSR